MGGGVIAIVGGIVLILAVIAACLVAMWAEYGWSGVRELAALYGLVVAVTGGLLAGGWLIVFGATQNGWLP